MAWPITNDAVRIESEIGRAIPRAHVAGRLRRALGRVRIRHATAEVTFTDVNGPKGGLDVRCVVQFALAGRPPISVARLGRTPRLAFDAAYEPARRALDRVLQRWEASERRPKKYFTAKRLLIALALIVTVWPVCALAQGPGTAPGDLELKTKKKATVVQPKPSPSQAERAGGAVQRKVETGKRLDEATKPAPPPRPDLDPSVSGGIQTKSLRRETTK